MLAIPAFSISFITLSFSFSFFFYNSRTYYSYVPVLLKGCMNQNSVSPLDVMSQQYMV